MQIVLRECSRCHQEKPDSEFLYVRGKISDFPICSSCKRTATIKAESSYPREDTPQSVLWWRSKLNSQKVGLEHTISPEDIPLPNTCKYIGLVLEYSDTSGAKDRRWSNSRASLDRIDSSKGYVPGNIQVISFLANRMKQDATIKELVRFAQGVLKVHG